MPRVTISDTKDYFLRDGKPFFYLADTVWMAVSNLSIPEWDEYLDCRAEQGFSAVQVSLLPILHDTSTSELNEFGFEIIDNKPEFYKINNAYFDKAVTMVKMAYERGLTALLMPLWCNYIPGTWAAERIGADFTIPYDAVEPYYEYITRRFAPYEPMYSVSGDTRFETQRVCDYYTLSLRLIRKYAPEALTTMHLAPAINGLPDVFVKNPDLDFYMYQSGHHVDENTNPFRFAKVFYSYPKRPAVNGEPSYEGHGHAFKRERFSAFEVRMASWQSLLSGSKAGVSYGAHGLWSFHRKDMQFTSELFSGYPYTWRAALRFQGAWDVAFAKWIFETLSLFDIEPVNKIESDPQKMLADLMAIDASFLVDPIDMDAFRMSESDKHVVIYAPYNIRIVVNGDYQGYDFSMYVMEDRRIAKPQVEFTDNKTIFKMHSFNSDVLIIGTKNEDTDH